MSVLRRYAIAVVLTSVALGLALLAEDAWGAAATYSFLLGAVMISSWVSGLGPGIMATVLGTFAGDYLTISPIHTITLDPARVVQLLTFVGISVLISSLNDSRRTALEGLRDERAQLEVRVTERTAELARSNHDLGERVKELSALNLVGRLLNERGEPADLLARIAAVLPDAWQYPEIAGARIAVGAIDVCTGRFQPTPWLQRAEFQTLEGDTGVLDIVYREPRPAADEGPFLAEERNLINLLAGMLRAYFERVHAEERRVNLVRAQAARLQAQEANAAKDQFLATLSHELRSPLNVMLGWTQMLRSGQMPADVAARGFDVLEHSTRLQAKLIDDLLDVSRIVTGKLSVDKRRIDLASVAGAAVDAARPAARARNITLTAAIAPFVILDGDPQRLQQVISNLLTNALKFTPDHGEVQVRVERVDEDARVVVHDTGIGIAPDLLPRMFDRFEQGDGSTPRQYGGMGLGLAIVKYLVEQHGGQVAAASDGPGCGATLTVSLPLPADTSSCTSS